jgi:hypothetical protein
MDESTPAFLAFDADGSLWALVRAFRIANGIRHEATGYDMIRHYDETGKLIGAVFPRSHSIRIMPTHFPIRCCDIAFPLQDGGCRQARPFALSGRTSECNNGQWISVGGSPIIIDTRGQGFHLTDVSHGVVFRFSPWTPPIRMSWTDPAYDNGFLALPGPDGLIHDATRLFGNITPQPKSSSPNGYLALATYDLPANGGNGNGVIDPGDAVYSRLRVWIDKNHNGISEPGELHTLSDMRIQRIDLTYHEASYVDPYGNQFRFKGRIWDSAGVTHDVCYDVFLQFGILAK